MRFTEYTLGYASAPDGFVFLSGLVKYPKLLQPVIDHSGSLKDEIAEAGCVEKTRRVTTGASVKLQQWCYSGDQLKVPVHK